MEVLILARESNSFGGVVNYVNILKSKFSSNINATDFTIGHREHSKNATEKILQPLRDGFRLFHHTLTHRYDIVYLNPSLDRKSILRDGFFLAILKAIRQRKIIVFFHGWDESYFRKIERNRVCSWAFHLLFSCSKVLVLAPEFRNHLVRLGFNRESIEVVSTMFDGDLLAQADKKQNPGIFQILFLARLIVEKGPYELLDAFAELLSCKDQSRLHLVMAGDGPEMEGLKAKIEEKGLQQYVHLPGYVRGAEKADIMMSSDVFILPSYSEGFPVSLLEAMAAGLPVICSRVGAIPEIVENNRDGILLDGVSKDEIAKALRFCIENHSFTNSAGEYNRKKAWETYEATAVTKKMEILFEKIVNE